MGGVPMRIDCKHYESRTYASGETVRMCRLDLAPEAPWRCPENCSGYERRIADAGWTFGSLQQKPTPVEPELTAEVASLLDAAEDVVNAIGPDVLAEVEDLRAAATEGRVQRLRRRLRFGRRR